MMMKTHPLLRRSVLIWSAVTAFALGAPVLATTQAGPFSVSVTSSPNPYAVKGTTSVTKSVGVLGYGTGTSDVALEGYATEPSSTGLEGFESATSGAGNGVFGYSAGANGSGVYGVSAATGGYGVFGDNTAQGIGVAGLSKANVGTIGESTSGQGVVGRSSSSAGVEGNSSSSYGVEGTTAGATPAAGVYGLDLTGYASGVYGESGSGIGVIATSDEGPGLETSSAASNEPALYAHAYGGGNGAYIEGDSDIYFYPVVTLVDDSHAEQPTATFDIQNPQGDVFIVHSDGSTYSANSVSAANNRATDSHGVEHQMYESRNTEAVSEDFGQAQMTGGRAYVALDPTFADVLGRRSSYIVFVTPEGDSAGLYVAQKTADGFVVRENGGGRASLTFDYRIVGKPANEKPKPRMPVLVAPRPQRRPQRLAAFDRSQQLALLNERLRAARRNPIAQIAPRPMPFVYRPGAH